jgi:Large extracellular alpha-helical protein
LTFTSNAPSATRLEKDAQPDKLYIDFSGSTARLEQVGKKLSQVITMLPPIKGEWTWETASRLCFSPQEDWAVGEKYTVTFARELFPKHVLLEKYQHTFSSASFDLTVTSSEFYTDPRDPKIKKALVSLKATHPIDEKSLKDHITLVKKVKRDEKSVLTDEAVPFTLSFDEFKGMAYIHSVTLPVPLEEYFLVVKISKGVRSSRSGDGTQNEVSADVRIPGMYDYFRINSVEANFVRNPQYEPKQVLVIETTAGARQEDIAKNLQVYLLPKDRPAIQGQLAQPDYNWNSWDNMVIGTEVLNLSQPIALEPIPTEQEFSTLHSFKYRADVGRSLFVRIKKGIKSYGDYILAKTFEQIVTVPEMPKELTILHDGSILSLAGKRTISIMARDIDTVKFDLGRVLPSQINHW